MAAALYDITEMSHGTAGMSQNSMSAFRLSLLY